MRVLVTGADGQLAKTLKELFVTKDFDACFASKKELDVSDEKSVVNFFKIKDYDFIVNCAAYTKVDEAQKDIKSALDVNYRALLHLKNHSNAKIVHISTDYVFSGKSSLAYKPTDTPDPINIYGVSKMLGEKVLDENSLIIRVSWLYSNHGKNFLKTILNLIKTKKELKIVDDQISAPTNANDLALFIYTVLKNYEKRESQIYHFSNLGIASWFDFACEICKIAKADVKISPIKSHELNLLAKRPHFSLLDIQKSIKDFSFEVPHWRDSLEKFLKGDR